VTAEEACSYPRVALNLSTSGGQLKEKLRILTLTQWRKLLRTLLPRKEKVRLPILTLWRNLTFCWPCIIVYQYNATNVMHFSFNLLRIRVFKIIQALLPHPQEVMHERPLMYCVRIMSVSCATIAVQLQSWHSQLTYARNIPSAVCVSPPEDEQVMLETCRDTWFSINWMKSALFWFHYTDLWRKLKYVLQNCIQETPSCLIQILPPSKLTKLRGSRLRKWSGLDCPVTWAKRFCNAKISNE
jgi:hypothetical protein